MNIKSHPQKGTACIRPLLPGTVLSLPSPRCSNDGFSACLAAGTVSSAGGSDAKQEEARRLCCIVDKGFNMVGRTGTSMHALKHCCARIYIYMACKYRLSPFFVLPQQSKRSRSREKQSCAGKRLPLLHSVWQLLARVLPSNMF